jgi:hypothetical protein
MHTWIMAATCSLTPLLAGCNDTGVGPAEPADHTPMGGAIAASLVGVSTEPFGSYGGVAVIRTTGMFEGVTSLGAFRVPFEIVIPEDPAHSIGVVLVEPPHFAFGPIGRDGVLGRDLLFGMGFAYAAVGWGDHALNILDPSAPGLLLADELLASPGAPRSLVKDGPLRVTVVVVEPGGRIAEHEAPGPITVQPLDGWIRFTAQGATHELGPGQLLALGAGLRHSVSSEEGGAFLRTHGHPGG